LLKRFYEGRVYNAADVHSSAGAHRNAQSLLRAIARLGPYSARRKLLDFGCGGGYFLAQARNAGWSVTGFDAGRAALESCRSQQFAVTCELGELEPASFDVIVLNHVLEHIEDPGGLLASLRTLLAPQGKLFIEVPNVRSARARLSLPLLTRRFGFDERYRAFPIHLWYFSPVTLRRLVGNAGYSSISWTTRGIGLEELLRCESAQETEADAPAQKPADGKGPQSRWQPAKNLIKKTYCDLGLGENVFLTASPRG